MDRATSPRRFFVLLVGTFACLGLLLASLGIYGVISYSVTRQTQEIGIRMALGATETSVQLEVIWKTLRLALIGIAVGIIASLAVARLIASLLFRTASTDPLTFVGMVFYWEPSRSWPDISRHEELRPSIQWLPFAQTKAGSPSPLGDIPIYEKR